MPLSRCHAGGLRLQRGIGAAAAVCMVATGCGAPAAEDPDPAAPVTARPPVATSVALVEEDPVREMLVPVDEEPVGELSVDESPVREHPADEEQPVAFVPVEDVLDYDMFDVHSGATVNLRTVVKGDKPLLFWFWSPL